MKPKILQVVGDNQMGGIKSTLDGLVNSYLSTEFEFSVLPLNSNKSIFKCLYLKPDIIMCSQASRLKNLPILKLLKLLNPHTKIVIREHHYSHCYEQFNVSNRMQFHKMLKLNYCLASQVIAISQAQVEWMTKNSLVLPKKLTLIQQCTPIQKLFTITQKPRDKTLVLAAYGRFCSQKGFDILLKALKMLQHIPVRLYLGGEGPQEHELKQLARGLENTEFVGRVDDLPSFLQIADVVVIPSRWEPWGNVCLEAKAAGKPVIASSVDGLTEQVQYCGILTPPDNPKALSQAIQHLVSLPQTQIEAWGSNGRKSVRGSWEQYLNQWRTLLWEVLEH